ncbi:PREDICTED: leucine-rich repeat and coiled-coil domain-containing protein 1-like [Tarenaya hassleriana]|uniref:leucine-rich repeat and coiled-coil domain-containing protein 1-like n=1 Tax=Tarenaya hassleriana TaxID=28532 RepID=UPI00053C69CF|nr:PREDICTED: leucine-rich repeat and coiled-coil domain-containing protein 1-like [Tarenaya hassleriana]
MAAMKLVSLFLLALVFTSGVFANAGVADDGTTGSDGGDALVSEIQIDQLNAKIYALESQIDEKTRKLKGKEELIAEKEKRLQERQNKIGSLQAEVSSLREKGSSDSAEQLGKAQARAVELENRIETLRKELEKKNKEKESTEARTSEAEKKLSVLNSRLVEFQKTKDEQESKMRKLERALQIAEEEILRLSHEATSKAKELHEVHGAWLPPWLAMRWIDFQISAETHWDAHGKPAMDLVLQKATEAKDQAGKWAEPHVETMKTKYIPAAKEGWVTVRTYIEPHVQTMSTKAREAYEASKAALSPHVVMVQEYIDPYYQEAKVYVDQVATATKPHVDRVRVAAKPYTKKVTHVCKKFLKSASAYHHQVQGMVEEKLKKHELTETFATKEFVWFTASALLALPIYAVYKLSCSLFCKKGQKPARHPHHHGRRKAKRGHSDK